MNFKTLSLLLYFSVSALCNASEYQHLQKNTAKGALADMLTKTVGPFLIIVISGTDKYIQFYNDNPGLLLDLPVNPLTDAEMKLAAIYFSKNGISSRKFLAKNPDSGEEFVLVGWKHAYDEGELDKVLDVAFGALFEIYGISNTTHLSFIRGWE